MKKELELETGARSHPFVQAKAKAEAAHTHALLLSLRFFQILKDPNPRKRRKIEKSDPFETRRKKKERKKRGEKEIYYIFFGWRTSSFTSSCVEEKRKAEKRSRRNQKRHEYSSCHQSSSGVCQRCPKGTPETKPYKPSQKTWPGFLNKDGRQA